MAIFGKNSGVNSSEISKIKKQIDQYLAVINNDYTEIGRIVKIKHMGEINDTDIVRYVAEIDNLLSQLKVLTKQINELKGIRECVNCHGEISTQSAFCPLCGAKQPVVAHSVPQPAPISQAVPQPVQPAPIPQPVIPTPAVEPSPIIAPVAEPAPVVEPTPIIESAPAPAVQPVSAAPATQYIFCTKCGHKETADTKFCSECGSII